MKYSIIVPTYNEEADIEQTLISLINIDWHDLEIIIVDDSSDSTPNIVKKYLSYGVKLIIPKKREGRCGARNIGILESKGDIVIILNADVHLPKDFIKKINFHYLNGADYVLVRSIVENTDFLFARYVEAMSVFDYYSENPKSIEWTEGFSCRKNCAIKAGLFPVGFPIPLVAGEDGYFGDNLRKITSNKVIDLNITCSHIAPATFSEYWYIRKGRGIGTPQIRYYINKWSLLKILFYAFLRITSLSIKIFTIFPVIYISHRFAKKSVKGLKDLLPFSLAWAIEQIAFSVGEFQSIIKIFKLKK